MQEENNVFSAKTADEAIEEGLKTLGITLDEAEITILEEGKKKLFGAAKTRVRIEKKGSDAKRAANFVSGLLDVLDFNATAEIASEGENIKINVTAVRSAQVIGKHGDVLDAIQTMAGAIANIGRDEYIKVVVDCEDYREQREKTLQILAGKVADKAIETGRKITLEPMSAYERRIIHSALSDNEQVKTVSEGKEPSRYIAVIPNDAKPYDKGIRYGERNNRGRGGKFGGRGERGGRDDRRGRGDRRLSSGGNGGARRSGGKKEIHFGTFLGNSRDIKD